jgi:uncharacterized protein (DUF433 family)
MRQLDRISIDPAIMGGKPCVRGTRITVGLIVGMVASEMAYDEILSEYPHLTQEDILQALAYAAWRAEEREVSISRT